jgi:hypothetical protein
MINIFFHVILPHILVPPPLLSSSSSSSLYYLVSDGLSVAVVIPEGEEGGTQGEGDQ